MYWLTILFIVRVSAGLSTAADVAGKVIMFDGVVAQALRPKTHKDKLSVMMCLKYKVGS